MNKLLISTAAVITAISSGLAVASPVCNWSGFNIGANVGLGWQDTSLRNKVSDGAVAWPDLAPGQRIGFSQNGFIGGGHVGIDWQSENFVYGLEVSGFGANIQGDGTTKPGNPYSAGDEHFSGEFESLFLANVRLGYAWNKALLSIKGGYAGGNLNIKVSDTGPPTLGSGHDTDFRSGVTVGAKVDYQITTNWIAGLAYDYVHFKSHSVNLGDSNAKYVFNDSDRNINLVFASISYRFDGGL